MSKRFFPFAAGDSVSPAVLRAGAGPGSVDIPIEQQLAAAFNANNAVLAYVNGITNTTLPDPNEPPSWYRSFRRQFPDAKIHAMKWINTIAPNLTNISAGIAAYALTWSTNMVNVDSALGVLIEQPRNADAARAVLTGLNRLVDGLGDFQSRADNFRREVDDFSRGMTINTAGLREGAELASREFRGNRQEVERLVASVKRLQTEIRRWQAVQTAAAIASGVTVYVGTGLTQLTVECRFAIGVAGATAQMMTVIAANSTIKQLCAQIQRDKARMGDLDYGLGLLQFLATMLGDLASLAQSAGDQIKLVAAAWKRLGIDLRTVVNDLQSAGGDATRFDVAGLQRDLRATNEDWAKLREYGLKIAAVRYLDATPAIVTLAA